MPRILLQIVAAAISAQPYTPILGISTAPVSAIPQISVQISQVSVPQSGPTIQMPAGQAISSTIATSQL